MGVLQIFSLGLCLSFHIFSYLCVFTSARTSIWNGVLVQAAVTEYHRLSSLNSTHVFLTVLEAGRLTISVPVWRGSWCEPSSWFTEGRCIAMSSHGGEPAVKQALSSPVSSRQDTHASHGGPTAQRPHRHTED